MSDAASKDSGDQPEREPDLETADSTVDENPKERVFTESQVKTMISAAVEKRLAREARKQERAKSDEKDSRSDSSKVEQPELARKVHNLERELATVRFDKEINARGIQDEAVVKFLKDSYDRVPADSRESWWNSVPFNSAQKGSQDSSESTSVEDVAKEMTDRVLGPPASDAGPPGVPVVSYDGPINVMELSKSEVSQLRSQGRLLDVLEEYRNNLEGGSGNLFARKRALK